MTANEEKSFKGILKFGSAMKQKLRSRYKLKTDAAK